MHFFNFGIKKFEAYSDFEKENQIIVCLLDTDETKIKKFSDFIKKKKPEKAIVHEIRINALFPKCKSSLCNEFNLKSIAFFNTILLHKTLIHLKNIFA